MLFEFATSEHEYVIQTEIMTNDYFVVRDEKTKLSYIMNIDGLIVDNEPFVSIIDFGEGYFLTSKNGKYYLYNPQNNLKSLVENYTGYCEVYLPQFNIYLTEDDGLYTIYKRNQIIESDVSIEIDSRENYVSLTAIKNNVRTTYQLTLGDNFGDKSIYFGQSSQLSHNHEDDACCSAVDVYEDSTMVYYCEDCREQTTFYLVRVKQQATCVDYEELLYNCEVCGYEHIAYGLKDTSNHKSISYGGTSSCHQKCTACNTVISTTHSYSSQVTKAATCIAKGETTYTCACGYSYKSTNINMTNHKYENISWNSGHATATLSCTTSGCTSKLTSTSVNKVVTTEATCTVSEKYQHEATFSVYGSTKTYKCNSVHTGSSLGHSWGNSWTVEKEATCNEVGKEYQTCSRCSAKKYREISKLSHIISTTPIWNANHTSATLSCTRGCGQTWTSGAATEITTVVADCNTERQYYHQVTFAVNGSTYSCGTTHTGSKNASNHEGPDEFGGTAACHKKCSACGVATSTAHSYTSQVTKYATCIAKGETTYTCACGYAYTLQNIPVLGHDYNDVVTPPTCLEDGYTTHTCKRADCGHVYVDAIVPAHGHSYNEVVSTTDTTETRKCIHCGDEITVIVATSISLSYNSIFINQSGIKQYSYPKSIKLKHVMYSYASKSYTENEIVISINENNGVLTFGSIQHLGASLNFVMLMAEYVKELTENFVSIGQNGVLDFFIKIDLGSGLNESQGLTFVEYGDIAYYQPQTRLTYDITMHKDTPYNETATKDHDCSNSATHETKTFKYFDLLDYTNEDIKNADSLFNITSEHYDLLGFIENRTTYLWATGNNAIDATLYKNSFYGEAFNVDFNNSVSVNLAPMWKGRSIKLSYKPCTDDGYILLEDGTKIKLTDNDLIDEYGSYFDISQLDNDYVNDCFNTPLPNEVHTKVLYWANYYNELDDQDCFIARNYIQTDWRVCDKNGNLIEYTDYTSPSATFESDSIDEVHVVAIYRVRNYEMPTSSITGVDSNSALWREVGDLSDGVAGSIVSQTAEGFVDYSTITWSNDKTNWSSLSVNPTFNAEIGGFYIKINIQVKNPDGNIAVTDPSKVAYYYRFTSITFDDFYNLNGVTPQTITFTCNYVYKSTNNLSSQQATWSTTSTTSIRWEQCTTNPSSEVVFFIPTMCSLDNQGLNVGESGCSISVNDLETIYEDSNKTSFSNGENYSMLGGADDVKVWNIYASTSGAIHSSNGKNAGMIEPSFDGRVDSNCDYNQTHMLAIKPQTRYVQSVAAGNLYGSNGTLKVVSNYISSIKATITNKLSKSSLRDSISTEYGETDSMTTTGFPSLLEYHKDSFMSECSSGNSIVYRGKIYQLTKVKRIGDSTSNYCFYYDVYIGKLESNSAKTIYEDSYIYFIFYNGQIKFEITMTDINFGSIVIDTSSTGTYSADSALNYTYKDFSNLADSKVAHVTFNNQSSGNPAAMTNSTLNSLKIQSANIVKLKPTIGFLIEEFTITLTPSSNSNMTGSTSRTYKLCYDDDAFAVATGSNYFTKIKYEMVGSETKFEYNGLTFGIQDLCDFKYSTLGRTSDVEDTFAYWAAAEDVETKTNGTVWLSFAKLTDNVEISYKVVSYLDVLLNQYKSLEVDSSLKFRNMESSFVKSD